VARGGQLDELLASLTACAVFILVMVFTVLVMFLFIARWGYK